MATDRPFPAVGFSLEAVGAPGTVLSPRDYKWEKK
jgi:hypothetical protein